MTSSPSSPDTHQPINILSATNELLLLKKQKRTAGEQMCVSTALKKNTEEDQEVKAGSVNILLAIHLNSIF